MADTIPSRDIHTHRDSSTGIQKEQATVPASREAKTLLFTT